MLSLALFLTVSILSSARLTRLFRPEGWTEKMILISAVMAGQIMVVVQVLSLLHALTPAMFLWAHAALSLALVVACRRFLRTPRREDLAPRPGAETPPARQAARESAVVAVLLCAFLTTAFALFWMDVSVFPTTGDTYHVEMPVYWMQNRTALPFPTHNLRQTAFGFVQEAMTLPLFLYLRSGRLAFLPEFFAFLVLPFLVAATARALGFRAAASYFAGFLATGYTALLGAAWNGVNDLLSAVYVVAAFALVFSPRDAGNNPAHPRLLAASVFLFLMACGIKTTAMLIAPLYALHVLVASRRRLIRPPTMLAVFAAALIGVLVSGLAWRTAVNRFWFGHWGGAPTIAASHFAQPGWAGIWTRNLRGIYYLCDFTSLPAPLTAALTTAGSKALTALGARNPLPGEAGYFRFDPAAPPLGRALGPLGILLFVPCVLTCAFGLLRELARRKRPISPVAWRRFLFAAYTVLVFVIYHGAMNWQPKGLVRLSMPFVLLGAPLAAAAYDRKWLRWPAVAVHLANVALIVIVTTLPFWMILRDDEPATPLLRGLVKRQESSYDVLWSDAGGSCRTTTIRIGESLRPLFREVRGRIPAGSAVGFIGQRDEYDLFGPRFENRVTPLLDMRPPYRFVRPEAKLDYVVLAGAGLIREKGREFLRNTYPEATLVLNAVRADNGQPLLELYRVRETAVRSVNPA